MLGILLTMLRIVGGINRSRKINRVEIDSTRETSDKVRESVFNLIGQTLSGVSLDLFAGSGAYGLEALSRGSSFCYFFDNNKKAITTIIDNAKALKEEEKSLIKLLDYEDAISYLEANNIKLDFVFLDPPYDFLDYSDIVNRIAPLLYQDGLVICEMQKNTSLLSVNSLSMIKERVYGIKKIIVYSRNDNAN